MRREQCLDNRLDTAYKNLGQVVPVFFYPVVGDAVLQNIVGADFLRAVGGAYLLFARRGVLGRLLLLLKNIELCQKHCHRLLAVCHLAALGLRARLQPCRPVHQAYGGLHFVDVLASRASGA